MTKAKDTRDIKASGGSKGSEKHSWRGLSMSRRSVGRVHTSFSLHTRVASLLEEDLQDALDPTTTAAKLWDQVLLSCLLLEALLLPFFLAFQPTAMESVSPFFVLVNGCELVFAADLYVQAHTGFYADGNLIRDQKRTIRRYTRSRQFCLDVAAILPCQALVALYPRVVAKVLFLKLVRWVRFPHLVSSLDEFYAKNFIALKLLKVLAATFYLAHVLACVRFSFRDDNSPTSDWLPDSSTNSPGLSRHYLISLFWSVGIMTGLFGGDLPRHSSEFLFTIFVALCGFAMFITLCATIFVISKCESGNTDALEARVNQLVHVLSFHRVPESQQAQAVEYLNRYYTDAESTDRETAKLLCPSIANDIQVELLKATIARVSLFKGCTDHFIVAMTSLLEMISVPAQTTLFSTGDYGDAMYIVHSGVLSVIVSSVTIREIRKGSCFGEVSVFSSIPRTATVISTTYSILFKLSRFHCERVLEGYPDCATVISDHVDDMLKQLDSNDRDAIRHALTSNSVMHPAILGNPEPSRAPATTGTLATVPSLVRMLSRKSSDIARNFVPLLLRKGPVSPAQPNTSYGRGARGVLPISTVHAVALLSPTSSLSRGRGLRKAAFASFNHQRGPQMTQMYKHGGLWRLVLLRRCIDQHSRVRMWWLLALLLNLCYCWLMIPVQVIFPLWQQPSWMTQTADTISNIVLVVDLFFNMNLSFMVDSEKIMDPKRSAKRYFTDDFIFDLICVFPYEYFHVAKYGLMRIPRLLRVIHLKRYLSQIQHFISLTSRRQLMLLGILLFVMFHIVACIHSGISFLENFDSHEDEAWILPSSLCLHRLNATHLDNCNGTIFDQEKSRGELQSITAMEYSRSLYYAVGVLTSPGKSVEPTSNAQLVVALALMLSGFLISAIVVDNVQKRFTASAFEQKEFFEARSRIQLFLRRQKVPLVIHHRAKSFLDYWWSAHRGAIISELLADLPRSVRLELLTSICLPVLKTLALLPGVHSVRNKLEEVMVENAKFILYGQGETVYRHGDYVTGLYFLLEGEVSMIRMGGAPYAISPGKFFGVAALTQQNRGEGYTEHVSANSGCILLFVSRHQLQAMEAIFPAIKAQLVLLDQRVLTNNLANVMNTNQDVHTETTARILQSMHSRVKYFFTAVYDPDSLFVLAWETWVFIVMTMQWVLVMFLACFPLQNGHESAEALMVFHELSFVIDMTIRSRLGFYEYGNKIMDRERIKRGYTRSVTVVLDVAALLPLYAVNWCLPTHNRWGLLYVNKLLRLVKVPTQLDALETRYLKRTTELHLFKLLYYTFMLSHSLGCMWFNFASRVAVPNYTSSSVGKDVAFGDNPWLPSKQLEHGSQILQYMGSLYWSFGLMSSSGESDFPQTTSQCFFSVVTMTSGFFLFAYVIGNFGDIIELRSSESREFNTKMGAVRHMLLHFEMPEALQERVKRFLLFKRYHTITREHVLEHCLPPSLLTDIRLVFLKPMIEKVEFLQGMEASITRMLVSQFTQVLVSRGEFVFNYGDSGSDMFFVFTGVLDVLMPVSVAKLSKTIFKTVAAGLAGKDEEGNTSRSAGPRRGDNGIRAKRKSVNNNLLKVNEISGGNYFGENGLFTTGKRNAYIQAQTSCILYRLSRGSLELVFNRHPNWRQKVLRIANLHREQARLVQLSREEQRRGMMNSSGVVLSRSDVMNERAENLKDKRYHARLHRISSGQGSDVSLGYMRRIVLTPLAQLLDGLVYGAAVQSKFYLYWLRFIVACTGYVIIMIPYELTMDSMERDTMIVTLVKVVELLCEVVFAVDIWFSWHVQESAAAMELYDQNLHSVYMKKRMIWDVIAAIPFYDLLSWFNCSVWFKLLRCIKVCNIGSYLDDLNRRSVSSEVARFWQVWMLYLLVIYWTACAYLAVATEAGFAKEWDSWLPSEQLDISDPQNPSSAQITLRLLRGLFFAATTFIKKTYSPAPEIAWLYAFHIAISFFGLIMMSYVIGELASLFISYIGLEVGFRKNHIAVELYLARYASAISFERAHMRS